ncbi:MAG TPA: NYN domain-containing protein [Candidatus Saccharimonadales bacterium]|nr:NYN domain-containing protein [Candidatus Saccharimonadales bacterium]
MQQNRSPRVYAFIDSQNLNVSVQKFGWKLDWRKFRKFLNDEYGVSKAYMFIGYVPENEDLYDQMHDAGYMVVLKPTFDITKPRQEVTENDPPEDKKPVKGNIDADLVLWAMKEMSSYDKAIIVSGDGDFYSLVEYLESKGRLLHLLAPSGHYSQLYNTYEKYIVQLDKFRRELAYHGYSKKK